MPDIPTSAPDPRFDRDIYSVSRLNREVRSVLEGSFPLLWVEGEISNLALPSSGHAYFSLKDGQAQVRCALFRMVRTRLRFLPRDGMQVLARVRVSLYEGRGEFQLIVEHLEPAGEGALRQAFERLKQRLKAEGLFDAARKRPLPAFPRQIGVVTSPSGAAVRDVLTTLARRMPSLPVVIYPTQVQGEDAPRQILRALELANRRAECDLLLLVRGGGSLEDLMAFNDEAVARAVAASAIPVVVGVGHEVDFSIADFVADRRAATPTAAAELVSPDRTELTRRLAQLAGRLTHAQGRRLRELRVRLEALERRLAPQHPAIRLAQRQQRIDELELRLRGAMGRRLTGLRARLGTLGAGLRAATPVHRLERIKARTDQARRRLVVALERRLARLGERLGRAGATLDAVSPLATLARGYAIVTAWPEGRILRDVSGVRPGDRIQARLARGRLRCTVNEILGDESLGGD